MSSGPTVKDVSSYLKKTFTLEKFSTGEGASFEGGRSYGLQNVLNNTWGGSGSGSGNSSSKSTGGSGKFITQTASKPSNVTAITAAAAQNIPTSDDISKIKYDSPVESAKRPLGTITTLLDLTNRDLQENDLFPLKSETTWFARDTERRVLAFTPTVQEIPLRGPGAFGQRFSFDIGSIVVGDLLLGTVLQIRLSHWLEAQAQLLYQAGKITYDDVATSWEYVNSLGTAIIQQAELEVDGKTLETIDGDFINVFSMLYADFNQQFGVTYDHHGRIPMSILMAEQAPRFLPTEDGTLNCLLPFFFMRSKRQDALPMIAIREGLVKIHITLRPFEECVRQLRGYRDSCSATPLNRTFAFHNGTTAVSYPTVANPPAFKFIQLLTQGAIVNGPFRQRMLRAPFEIIHRELQTFYFEEPLKYAIGKRSTDTIRIQLPLEANHPIEEIIWFVRRRGVRDNNSWTNYSSVLEAEWNVRAARQPLLQNAILQANGVTICDADEQYYRQLIAGAHKGGAAAYNNFIYGYPFAKTPGEHQPSGSFNASRVSSLRLILDVKPPGGILDGNWEVKVFCIALNWLRFENGIANPMFED